MKIKKIEYKNFRNFRDQGAIECSTDGRVTIIYGKNGVGKTTMHQLIHWIFYNDVHFNKTASNKLYNLTYEKELPLNTHFDVMGRVEFEHAGSKYSLTRTNTYRKGLKETTLSKEELVLLKQDSDYNWRKMSEPEKVIEKILPSGLSEYFFFDGESMIADLSVKGQDSANKLRTALYSMFELDVLEAAINHIGNQNLRTTIIGKLFLKKGEEIDDDKVAETLRNINNAQNIIEKYKNKISRENEELEKNIATIKEISETIGAEKNKQDYEIERAKETQNLELYLNSVKKAEANFGDKISSIYPQLLIAKVVQDTTETIKNYASKVEFPLGLSKELIDYLTEKTECICGNPLHEQEKEKLRSYLNMMYPNSYDNIYSDYYHMAQRWNAEYSSDLLNDCISDVLAFESKAEESEKRIKDLDAKQAQSPDVSDLIAARSRLEKRNKDIEDAIVEFSAKERDYRRYLEKQNKIYKKQVDAFDENAIIDRRLEIMEAVLKELKEELSTNSKTYSEKLQDNIQELLDKMLTSKRKVSVSESFQVTVFDNNNDESKSEGQFAVVSFAYIGGILKMLKSEEQLSNKEYPLVLDGPFSKLDEDQRQNVIDNISDFAPQVILFSKDDLRDCFPEEKIGATWTIFSNDDSNIAHVEEGYAW